jgi:hypothetical protein
VDEYVDVHVERGRVRGPVRLRRPALLYGLGLRSYTASRAD